MCEATQIIAVFMVLSLPVHELACFYVFFFLLCSSEVFSVHTVKCLEHFFKVYS